MRFVEEAAVRLIAFTVLQGNVSLIFETVATLFKITGY
jgi:hypothetical protein